MENIHTDAGAQKVKLPRSPTPQGLHSKRTTRRNGNSIYLVRLKMFDVHQQIDNIRGTNILNSLTLPALSPHEMAVPLKPLVHPVGIPRMTLYLPYHFVLKER